MADADQINQPTANRSFNDAMVVDANASRLDGVAKVTGRARYARDVTVPGMLYVQGIRSPWGVGKLAAIDVPAAKAIPGVVDVVVERDTGEYDGDWIGHVVAESRLALRRAMRALAPRWERGEPKVGIDPGQVVLDAPDEGASAAYRRAAHIFEAEYSTPVQTHSALETHGLVVEHRGESAIVHASTQGTFAVAEEIARFIGLPRSRYEVRCEYVGGGFGAKFQIGREGSTAATVAAATKRSVHSFCTRREEHLDTGNRPSSHIKVKLGVARDGAILGGQIAVFGGTGVARGGGGASIPSRRYALGEVSAKTTNVRFNAGAPRAMRAPGHPQGAFAEELMLDEVAALAGVDPLELRLRLDTDESGARRAMYRAGAEMIGWSRRHANGAVPEEGGPIRTGLGVGSTSWGALRGPAQAEIVVHRDGAVELRSGAQDIGTGFRTVIGIAAADALGVPLESIDVRIGRSTLPEGPASGGSVTTPSVTPAVIAAAQDAKRQLLEVAAQRLGVAAARLTIVGGNLRDGERVALAWADLCRLLPTESVVGSGRFDGRGGTLFGEGHSHGVQFAEVEVDIETGVIGVRRVIAFQACGRILCRKTAESQVIGGVIQGLSYALFENRLLDRKTGAMVNPNLEAYKILGSVDMPVIEPILWSDATQTGARGLGEPPVIPTAGAVACAVLNAVGAPVRHLPMTPDKVLAAVDAAAAQPAGQPADGRPRREGGAA
ncbi:MAG TPA: xanthine dehydrogenase family protein molybdopterin-binding subunit [Phycisphaerales bacterium]|nr:xanthine dehydrogenase family protein molybdopterin-binding subunit [Phycisphaerales bacterium]HMP38599.1 xanthine dehydrogenase family protein molybdopterin-binding subunit [Phycisphaerales bacterium]